MFTSDNSDSEVWLCKIKFITSFFITGSSGISPYSIWCQLFSMKISRVNYLQQLKTHRRVGSILAEAAKGTVVAVLSSL
jgi:hypothetical protein